MMTDQFTVRQVVVRFCAELAGGDAYEEVHRDGILRGHVQHCHRQYQ